MDPIYNNAYGSFLGLMCGDAAGATLEFYHGQITDRIAEEAMRMPGGGHFQVGKGQITDDSELALSLAQGLSNKSPKDGYPLEPIATKYSEWYLSRPFDIGNTCSIAFSVNPGADGTFAGKMLQAACNGSYSSEANGALMRIAPLAIWSCRESVHTIIHNAKMDSMLSHPNVVCQECNAALSLAIVHLIKNPGDHKGAIASVEDYMNHHVLSRKVKQWFNESMNIEELECTKNIGHVRWGFTLAMYFLRTNASFESAVKLTLMKGGDTDTNAAIVGAVIGALYGENGIPGYMKGPVLSFNVENPGLIGRQRPKKYQASLGAQLVKSLLDN